MEQKKKFFSSSTVAKIAVFSALSYVLYLWPKFPIASIFPSWLEFNFSDIPMLIGGFALGPLAGVIIVIVKILLKLPFSTTVFVGELADLIIGISFVLPASLVYKYHKNIKGALFGTLIGLLCSTVASMFVNRFILIPCYLYLNNWTISTLVGACSKVLKGVNEGNFYTYYTFFAVLPFNLIRCTVCGLLTFLLYKKISIFLNRF